MLSSVRTSKQIFQNKFIWSNGKDSLSQRGQLEFDSQYEHSMYRLMVKMFSLHGKDLGSIPNTLHINLKLSWYGLMVKTSFLINEENLGSIPNTNIACIV